MTARSVSSSDSHHLGGVGRRVAVECHLNLGGLIHHVIVGEDKSLLVDDHARTKAALRSRPLIGKIEEPIEKILKWLLLLVALLITRAHLVSIARLALGIAAGALAAVRSITCVVEIFTTAGCTLLHDRGKGAGQLHGIRNCQRRAAGTGRAGCEAPTRPEITVPINMPMASVTVTNSVAIIFRFRAQAANSRNCIPIISLLFVNPRGQITRIIPLPRSRIPERTFESHCRTPQYTAHCRVSTT